MLQINELSVHDLTALVADLLLERTWYLACAESCTGGLIAAACTERAGASAWFDRGFVTYSNAAKTALLGVPADLIAAHGAVSAPVAAAMASGAVERAGVDVALSVTGVAGPDGGTPAKPVGTVWFGWACQGEAGVGLQIATECRRFDGDRSQVRAAAVHHALAGLAQRLTVWGRTGAPG